MKKIILTLIYLTTIAASSQENYCKHILQEEVEEPTTIAQRAEYNDLMEAMQIQYDQCVGDYYKDLEEMVQTASSKEQSLEYLRIMAAQLTESLSMQESLQIYDLEEVEETIGYQEIQYIMEIELQEIAEIAEEEILAQREVIESEDEYGIIDERRYESKLIKINPVKPSELKDKEYIKYYDPAHPYSDESGYTYYSKNN